MATAAHRNSITEDSFLKAVLWLPLKAIDGLKELGCDTKEIGLP
ncbi:hypothetical protein SNOG_00867 [Parastagonospora nodorum SN15]|uniref:Uncharacterized protein n=1 Tax=Phaeosphaeria nodorum (strain SN15 / ATCC MYA-4574 / FGSC 10173) TaxID=321614 RepID=Q0V547_PHANO|nr:hypothetical protein SNOG_00867 [Parastagonospora nodorum SN15]EAT92362.1 hypothetical protein SNOG_00867 [Parastagonospora nodorum SN15]